MNKVAGIFLINKDNKILLCHPTKHSPKFWSIPKGRVEEGETVIDAAVRETIEETNADVKGWSVIHTLAPVNYSDRRVLHSFAIFESENSFDFSSFDLKCNSNVPPEKGGFPEMDGYKWGNPEEAIGCVHKTQEDVLNELIPLIKKVGERNRKIIIKK